MHPVQFSHLDKPKNVYISGSHVADQTRPIQWSEVRISSIAFFSPTLSLSSTAKDSCIQCVFMYGWANLCRPCFTLSNLVLHLKNSFISIHREGQGFFRANKDLNCTCSFKLNFINIAGNLQLRVWYALSVVLIVKPSVPSIILQYVKTKVLP